jgi:hypothetical protein
VAIEISLIGNTTFQRVGCGVSEIIVRFTRANTIIVRFTRADTINQILEPNIAQKCSLQGACKMKAL